MGTGAAVVSDLQKDPELGCQLLAADEASVFHAVLVAGGVGAGPGFNGRLGNAGRKPLLATVAADNLSAPIVEKSR